MNLTKLIVMTICSMVPSCLLAEIVFDNGANPVDGAFYFPFVSDSTTNPLPQVAADDVEFDMNTQLNQIQWTGSYIDPGSPMTLQTPGTDNFTIRIYSDDGNTPGMEVARFNVGNNVNRQVSSATVPGNPGEVPVIYEFAATIDFVMLANNRYWMTVVNDTGTADGKFNWGATFSSLTNGGNLQEGLEVGGNVVWTPYVQGSFGAAADIRLDGMVTAIPEPVSIATFAIGICLLHHRRRV